MLACDCVGVKAFKKEKEEGKEKMMLLVYGKFYHASYDEIEKVLYIKNWEAGKEKKFSMNEKPTLEEVKYLCEEV